MSDSQRHTPLLYEIIHNAFLDVIVNGKNYLTSSELLNSINVQDSPKEKARDESKKEALEKKKKNIFGYDLENDKELNRRIDKVEIALKKELSFYELSGSSSSPVEETKLVFEQLKAYLNTIKKTKDSSDSLFLPAETLSSFLSSYYALFRYLFSDTILLDEKIDSRLTVSDFFALFPGKSGESLYTPYAAESTLKLYKALDDARRFIETEEGNHTDKIVKKMIASIYATKAFRDYRRIIIIDGKQYLLSCENTDKLNLKNISDLSSIEMVKPIRLFGKIKRYIKALEQDKNTKDITCRIKIIGTVYIEPDSINSDELCAYSPELYDLCRWISNNYQKDEQIQQFQIDVHINENSLYGIRKNAQRTKELNHDLDERINVTFYFKDYAELSSKDGLDELMNKTEALLFFLDCPFLYDNLHIVSHDQHLYDWVRSLPASYPDESLSLAELGPVQKYQNQLNMFLLYRNERTAHFERRLRDRRIEYISDKVKSIKKENPDNKTEVFIFISSQSSIDRSEYARTFQIRKEEYNSKEMCLLHFGREIGDSGESLSCKEDDKFNNKIQFSLWNILVNTDPALIEDIKGTDCLAFPDDTVAEDLASEIFITFSWKKIHPFSEAELLIEYSKKLAAIPSFQSDEIEPIIKSYFEVIFSNQHDLDPTLLRCLRNSFYNVFFGKISNVFQAIAFNRIQAALENGRSIKIKDIKLEGEATNNEDIDNNERDFVTKRTKAYVGVIDNLSKAYPSPTLRDILVSRMRAAGMLPQEVYDKIITACEQSDYTDDELYQNTIMARSDLL